MAKQKGGAKQKKLKVRPERPQPPTTATPPAKLPQKKGGR